MEQLLDKLRELSELQQEARKGPVCVDGRHVHCVTKERRWPTLPALFSANRAAQWQAEVEAYQQEAAKDLAYVRLTLLVAGFVLCFLMGLLVGQLREHAPEVEAPLEETYPADVPRGLSGAHTLYSL